MIVCSLSLHAYGFRQQRRSTLSAQDPSKEADEKKKTDLAKKLRQQMHKSLKKTAEQLKQEEAERIREQMRERKASGEATSPLPPSLQFKIIYYCTKLRNFYLF